jgi:uncharacterized membrane-anchored protein
MSFKIGNADYVTERIITALCHLDIEIPDVEQAKTVLHQALVAAEARTVVNAEQK